MYRPCLKSKLFEYQNPYMWFSKESNGAKVVAPNSIGDWSIPDCSKSSNDGQQAPFTAIVIVEPRQMRLTASGSSGGDSGTTATSSSSSYSSEWFMLPESVDVSNDVLRLVSSLSTVVQILTRMTNVAAQELRLHPERQEGFQGLRMLLNYADQMYTTLLQPQTFSSPERSTAPTRNVTAQQYSLFHHLFEPMLGTQDREQEPLARQLLAMERPLAFPYRVVAVAAGIAGVATPDSESTGSNAPTEIGANVN